MKESANATTASQNGVCARFPAEVFRARLCAALMNSLDAWRVTPLRSSLSVFLFRKPPQDLRAMLMGSLIGAAAAAAADVLKVFAVSSRVARLVMTKVDRPTNLLQ